jgi:hypothetical protein
MPRRSVAASATTTYAAVAPTSIPSVDNDKLTPSTSIATSTPTSTPTSREDQALKNINYKNMLLTGNYGVIKPDVVTHPNIDDILEKEKNSNKGEPWNKLDKSAKVMKLKEFSMQHGKEQGQVLTDNEISALYQFLLVNLEQKKLARAKDVIYDKVTGTITSIPCLLFNATLKKFTLKRCEKRQSTLKSLAPTGMSKKRRLQSDTSTTSSTVTVSIEETSDTYTSDGLHTSSLLIK